MGAFKRFETEIEEILEIFNEVFVLPSEEQIRLEEDLFDLIKNS